jgi:hypothetical protein
MKMKMNKIYLVLIINWLKNDYSFSFYRPVKGCNVTGKQINFAGVPGRARHEKSFTLKYSLREEPLKGSEPAYMRLEQDHCRGEP